MTTARQHRRHFIDFQSGSAEDQRGVRACHVDHAGERRRPMRPCDDIRRLLDAWGRAGLDRFFGNGDLDRVLEMPMGDRADSWRDCR